MGVPEKEPQIGGEMMRDDTIRHVVVFLVIGAIAGWLASWIVGGSGLLGYLLTALKIKLPIDNVWLSQIVTATIGAIIVVIVAKLIIS